LPSTSQLLALLVLAIVAAALPAAEAPNPFENEIRAFEAKDKTNPPALGMILFLGSSSIGLWNLTEHFPGLDALNRGFGGSQIADSIHYFDRVVWPCRPRQVVFYAGDNDIASGKTPEQVAADFHTLVTRLHEALPDTRLTVISIKPSLARWQLVGKMREANRLIRGICKHDRRLRYLDVDKPMIGPDGKPRPELFQPDGLHLSPGGYRLWTAKLKPYLK
jgi:lysophospholipase L1-like esterase